MPIALKCFESKRLLELIHDTIRGLSITYSNIFRSNRKEAALKDLEMKVTKVCLEYDIIPSSEAIYVIKSLIKIAMTPRSNSFKTSSGKKLQKLINSKYTEFRHLIAHYLRLSRSSVKYEDLLTFADNFDPLSAAKKKKAAYGQWKERYNIFSIDKNLKVPKYFKGFKYKSRREVKDFKAYELLEDSSVFSQINLYISNNIEKFPYTSKNREATRVVRAEWFAKDDKLSDIQRLNAMYRMSEGLENGPTAPRSGDINVVKIEAVKNSKLWNSYINNKSRLEPIIKKHEKEALKRIVWHSEIENLPVVDQEMGEVFLFHQLTPSVADIICNTNFDAKRGTGIQRKFRFGGEITTKGMLGEGSYFSDSFSKCMTYSLCPMCLAYNCKCEGSDALRVTLLCRVIIGVPKHRPSYFRPYNRTTVRSMEVGSLEEIGRQALYARGAKADTSLSRDLLLSGSEINEFLVQDKCQIYPEFVVYWDHKNQDSDSVKDNPLTKLSLRKTPFNNPSSIDLPQLSNWQYYWKGDEKTNELWQLLNDNIINKPYVDDSYAAHTYRTYHGKKPVYRFNHGILHSLRQLMYVRMVSLLIKKYGSIDAKKVMGDVTAEEMALLELSCVLCRAGRTNEKGHRGDATYSFRSANIVKIVAERLLFNKQYTRYDGAIKYKDPSFSNMVALQTATLTNMTPKAALLKGLIDLSHHIDLIRTHSGGDVYQYTLEKFAKWFPDETHQEMTLLFIDYATKLCLATGDRICYKIFTPDSSKIKINGKLFVALSNDIPRCMTVLSSISFGGSGGTGSGMSSFPINPDMEYKLETKARTKHCLTCKVHIRKDTFCEVCGNGYFCSRCASKENVISDTGYPVDKNICKKCFKLHFKKVSNLNNFNEENFTGDYDIFENDHY